MLDRIIRLINEEKISSYYALQFYAILMKDTACEESVFSSLILRSMTSFLSRTSGNDLALQLFNQLEIDKQNELLVDRTVSLLSTAFSNHEVDFFQKINN